MIRTDTVELTVIKAVACRRKLMKGGAGIIIVRADSVQPGLASISKTSGEAIPAANTPKKLFPVEAFNEAIALTAGLPYKKRGSVQYRESTAPATLTEEEPLPEEAIVDSREYQAIVDRYTDKNGRLSYALLNRDMIRFARSSSIVRAMISDGAKPKEIADYVAGTKFRTLTGNRKLTDAQVGKIVELLDEVSPKGVFKEFNAEIRRSLKAAK